MMQLNIDFDVKKIAMNQCYLKNIILTLQSCWKEKDTYYSNLMLKINGKCIYRRFNFDKNMFWFDESSTHEKKDVVLFFENIIKENLDETKRHIIYCDAKL